MPVTTPPGEPAAALDEGRAFVDRRRFHIVEAAGADARRWLNDLVSTAVGNLPTGVARRALLLSPTGRVRADVYVVAGPTSMLLIQDPAQPRSIDELLAPYVLSSDIELRRVGIGIVCAPGADHDADALEGLVVRPSMLGGGFDVIAGPTQLDATARALRRRRIEVNEEDVRAWEIRRGVPRFPADLDEDSLPAEGGLDAAAIDADKGCFVGQESVAKVRNLGHPPRVVVAGVVQGRAEAGEPLVADGEAVGLITGASRPTSGERTDVLARIRWDARGAVMTTPDGSRFVLSRAESGSRAPA
jgi:tRNA-modifying protein YgfZ